MVVHRVALLVCLSSLLFGCNSFQPRQLTQADLQNGMPPLTGTLPNGIIGDNSTK